MISTFVKSVWLGYGQTGGAANLRLDELGGRLLLLGGRASEMAALLAFASREAECRPVILDLDGTVSSKVSGYFSSCRLADVLYDLYRLDQNSPRTHGELISSAYTAALDLTFEEEGILDAGMQLIASQDNIASPPVVYDALSGVEGFRGFYVDKLKGRIGTLKFLDAADSISMGEVLSNPEGSIVDLSGSGLPRAAELGGALFVAKLLSLTSSMSAGSMPGIFLINGAHRIFRALPRSLHGNRLLSAMFDCPAITVLGCDERQALSPLLIDACPTRILSADAWNQTEKDGPHVASPIFQGRGDRPAAPTPPPVLPNSFVIQNMLYGSTVPFLPRPFEEKQAPKPPPTTSTPAFADMSPPSVSGEDPALVKRILEEVGAYQSSSIASLANYLAPEFPDSDIEKAIYALEKEGFLRLAPKEQKSGRTMLVLSLTQSGTKYLGGVA